MFYYVYSLLLLNINPMTFLYFFCPDNVRITSRIISWNMLVSNVSIRSVIYHEMLEERKVRMRERQKDHAIIQVGKTLERGLHEVPTPATFYLIFHRENFQNECVNIAVINRLRRDIDLVKYWVSERFTEGNDRSSFVAKKVAIGFVPLK